MLQRIPFTSSCKNWQKRLFPYPLESNPMPMLFVTETQLRNFLNAHYRGIDLPKVDPLTVRPDANTLVTIVPLALNRYCLIPERINRS